MSKPIKKEQIIIRVSPKFKQRLEKTALNQGKSVSDFVRDILTPYLEKDNGYDEYMIALKQLAELKREADKIKQEIFIQEDEELQKEKMNELAKLQIKIIRHEATIYNFLVDRDN